MKVGFIGLGIMGSRMAANLQKHGYDLVVYNRTKEKADELLANGAQWADSPQEVGQQVEALFTMLATPEVVREMALGPHGFLETMQPGSTWIDSSTVNPSFSQEMAQAARDRQVQFLGAPVAGSRGPAESGELTFLVGGEKAVLEQVRPLLETMGKNIQYIGGDGMGAAQKMVLNLILGETMVVFSEALVLGEALGLERGALLNTLLSSPLVPAYMGVKRQKLETRTFEADFPLQWMRKDLHLAALSAYEKEVALPTMSAAEEVYTLAVREGLGGEDFSGVVKFIESRE